MKAWRVVTLVQVLAFVLMAAGIARAQVKPGDLINKDNASKVTDLLSPGNYILVQQGMQLNIIPSSKLDWPPPFKAATEKYSSQVVLSPDGTLKNYVAGQPFPLLDPNDPEIATKLMWNFSFRPLYSDDADLRFPEIASYVGSSKDLEPLSYFSVGHFAFYNNIGRIEVPPVPTSPDFAASGIRYRFGFYPFLEPAGLRGYGLIRDRHMDPTVEDNSWVFNPETRRLRRQSPEILADAIGGLPGFSGGGAGYGSGVGVSGSSTNVTSLDPDSYFGFSAKVEDFNYKYLGEKEMLACVHAKFSPEKPAPPTTVIQFALKTGRCAISTSSKPMRNRDTASPSRGAFFISTPRAGSSPRRINMESTASSGRRWSSITLFAIAQYPMPKSPSIPTNESFSWGWSMRTSRTAPPRWSSCREAIRRRRSAGISTWVQSIPDSLIPTRWRTPVIDSLLSTSV